MCALNVTTWSFNYSLRVISGRVIVVLVHSDNDKKTKTKRRFDRR